MKTGDQLWFRGLTDQDDGEEMPAGFVTCTGRRFSGYVDARLANGDEVTLPPHLFRLVEFGRGPGST